MVTAASTQVELERWIRFEEMGQVWGSCLSESGRLVVEYDATGNGFGGPTIRGTDMPEYESNLMWYVCQARFTVDPDYQQPPPEIRRESHTSSKPSSGFPACASSASKYLTRQPKRHSSGWFLMANIGMLGPAARNPRTPTQSPMAVETGCHLLHTLAIELLPALVCQLGR